MTPSLGCGVMLGIVVGVGVGGACVGVDVGVLVGCIGVGVGVMVGSKGDGVGVNVAGTEVGVAVGIGVFVGVGCPPIGVVQIFSKLPFTARHVPQAVPPPAQSSSEKHCWLHTDAGVGVFVARGVLVGVDDGLVVGIGVFVGLVVGIGVFVGVKVGSTHCSDVFVAQASALSPVVQLPRLVGILSCPV